MPAARHWAEWNEVTFVAGVRLLYAVHRMLGRWPFRLLLWPTVTCYWMLHAPARRASKRFLARWQRHFGAATVPGSLRHFMRFAEVLLDKLLAAQGAYPQDRVLLGDVTRVRELIASGQGGIMVTAHIGCLELCQAAASWVPGLRMNVLVHTRHAERFNALLGHDPAAPRLRLLQVAEIHPATAADLAARIADGEFVAIVGDRVPVGGGRTCSAPFLGEAAEFPVGAWVLAGLLRCPVFLLSCMRSADDARYRIEVEPVADVIEMPREQRAAVLQHWVNHYAAWLERRIAEAPLEWFNFFDFWSQRGNAANSR